MDKSGLSTALLGVLLLVFMAPAQAGFAAEGHQSYQFFFYHPDSVQNNLANLKSDMDGFFAHTGIAIQFQAFAHLADFDNNLRSQKPAFQWVPEWYVEVYGKKLGLKPFLVAVRRGHSTYRKVLVSNKKSQLGVKDLAGRTLAMTAMGPGRKKILDKILFAPNNISNDKLTIVEVPKDSDALLALILLQVDFALVSEENLQEMSQLSTAVEQNVTQLLKTNPIPMPYLCYLEGSVEPEEVLRMKDLFIGSKTIKKRKSFKEALQIDAWQPVSH